MTTTTFDSESIDLEIIKMAALAGLFAGVLFSAIIGSAGMLPMIAGLVSSDNVAIGLFVNLFNAAFIGALFGVIAPLLRFVEDEWQMTAAGAVYGLLWWALGGQVLMPLITGGTIFQFAAPNVVSLVGHIIYGAVLGYGLDFLLEYEA